MKNKIAIVLFFICNVFSVNSQNEEILGNWAGKWSNEKGCIYKFDLELNDDNNDNVLGSFTWELLKAGEIFEEEKVGLMGVEYVKGEYDSSTQIIELMGFEKDDPNNIFDLGHYTFTLSESNKALIGINPINAEEDNILFAKKNENSSNNIHSIKDYEFLVGQWNGVFQYSCFGENESTSMNLIISRIDSSKINPVFTFGDSRNHSVLCYNEENHYTGSIKSWSKLGWVSGFGMKGEIVDNRIYLNPVVMDGFSGYSDNNLFPETYIFSILDNNTLSGVFMLDEEDELVNSGLLFLQKIPSCDSLILESQLKEIMIRDEIKCEGSLIRLELLDMGIDKNEIISLKFNGCFILKNYRISKEGYILPVTLDKGVNMLELYHNPNMKAKESKVKITIARTSIKGMILKSNDFGNDAIRINY